jgi:hypothetical protein
LERAALAEQILRAALEAQVINQAVMEVPAQALAVVAVVGLRHSLVTAQFTSQQEVVAGQMPITPTQPHQEVPAAKAETVLQAVPAVAVALQQLAGTPLALLEVPRVQAQPLRLTHQPILAAAAHPLRVQVVMEVQEADLLAALVQEVPPVAQGEVLPRLAPMVQVLILEAVAGIRQITMEQTAAVPALAVAVAAGLVIKEEQEVAVEWSLPGKSFIGKDACTARDHLSRGLHFAICYWLLRISDRHAFQIEAGHRCDLKSATWRHPAGREDVFLVFRSGSSARSRERKA